MKFVPFYEGFTLSRCWNKKVTQIYQKFAKSSHKCYYTNMVFTNKPNRSLDIWATFVEKIPVLTKALYLTIFTIGH